MTTYVITGTRDGQTNTVHASTARDALAARNGLHRTCPQVVVTKDGRRVGEHDLAHAAAAENATSPGALRRAALDHQNREIEARNAERIACAQQMPPRIISA